MIARLIAELGPWSWWVLGLALLAAELAMPGVFLIWIGIAAIAVGALSLLLWEAPFWVWQLQMLAFAALAVAAILLSRKYLIRHKDQTDEPNLNERGASLVGRTAVLKEAIAEGRGRVKLDDTTWSVMGPDLPAGTRVRIISSSGRDLMVEPA